MLHAPHGRAGKCVGLALASLLVLVSLPGQLPSTAAPGGPRAAAAAGPAPAAPPGDTYHQTNLVSNDPSLALIHDPLLDFPWHIAAYSTNDLVVANIGSSAATLYRSDVCGSLLVQETDPASISLGEPATGVVVNTTGDFVIGTGAARGPARFIFTTNTGKVMAWRPNVPSPGSTTAVVVYDSPGESFGTPTIAFNPSESEPGNFLYITGGNENNIVVFDKNFQRTTIGSRFGDPRIPPEFTPSNIQNLDGRLYVTYGGGDEGAGQGFVRRFGVDGTRGPFQINGGVLTRPLGLALAPADFGAFSNALLVGNFGTDGPNINAFDPKTGAFLGSIRDESGGDLAVDRIQHLVFGNGGHAGDPNTLYFTGLDSFGRSLFGSLRPTAHTSAPPVHFIVHAFSGGEDSGHADITVVRDGDAADAATVNYATCDESASQKSDYETAAGQLTFAPGETSKTFRVLLVNDRFAEGLESFAFALSNPSGVELGDPSSSGLFLADDDTTTPTTNPIDEAEFFVRQHYLDFLNREPDPAGFDFWTNQITSCGSDAQCVEIRRVNVSAAFFLSIEFQRTGLLAYLTHRAAFRTRPPYGRFMRDTQALQRDFAFGTPGADAQLEANKQKFFNDFVAAPEFAAHFKPLLTTENFVDLLFESAGLTPTAEERQAVIAEFGGNPISNDLAARARALRRVAENPALAQREMSAAFVLMEYFGYLRRDPDEPGFQFWLGKLNSFGGNFVEAEMVKAFISSIEYRQRFGP